MAAAAADARSTPLKFINRVSFVLAGKSMLRNLKNRGLDRKFPLVNYPGLLLSLPIKKHSGRRSLWEPGHLVLYTNYIAYCDNVMDFYVGYSKGLLLTEYTEAKAADPASVPGGEKFSVLLEPSKKSPKAVSFKPRYVAFESQEDMDIMLEAIAYVKATLNAIADNSDFLIRRRGVDPIQDIMVDNFCTAFLPRSLLPSFQQAANDIIQYCMDIGKSISNAAGPYSRFVKGGGRIHVRGYLNKRGAVNTDWQQRWFVQLNSLLIYFKHSKGAAPEWKGTIILDGVKIEKYTPPTSSDSSKELKYQFLIQCLAVTNKENGFWSPVGGRNFILAANSEEEREQWISTLRLGSASVRQFRVNSLSFGKHIPWTTSPIHCITAFILKVPEDKEGMKAIRRMSIALSRSDIPMKSILPVIPNTPAITIREEDEGEEEEPVAKEDSSQPSLPEKVSLLLSDDEEGNNDEDTAQTVKKLEGLAVASSSPDFSTVRKDSSSLVFGVVPERSRGEYLPLVGLGAQQFHDNDTTCQILMNLVCNGTYQRKSCGKRVWPRVNLEGYLAVIHPNLSPLQSSTGQPELFFSGPQWVALRDNCVLFCPTPQDLILEDEGARIGEVDIDSKTEIVMVSAREDSAGSDTPLAEALKEAISKRKAVLPKGHLYGVLINTSGEVTAPPEPQIEDGASSSESSSEEEEEEEYHQTTSGKRWLLFPNEELQKRWYAALLFVKASVSIDLEYGGGGRFPPEFQLSSSDFRTFRKTEIPSQKKVVIRKVSVLRKQGGNVKNWKTRTIILYDWMMCYFDRAVLKGFFSIRDAAVETLHPQHKNGFVIRLQQTQRKADPTLKVRDYYFEAKSEAEMNSWMKALNDAIESAPYIRINDFIIDDADAKTFVTTPPEDMSDLIRTMYAIYGDVPFEKAKPALEEPNPVGAELEKKKKKKKKGQDATSGGEKKKKKIKKKESVDYAGE